MDINRLKKFADCLELVGNNADCAILKVKDGKNMDLITLGCFDGDEVMFRLTKGDDHTCTEWTADGKHFSWDWGYHGYTLVSEKTSEAGKMVEEVLTDIFDIDVHFRGVRKTGGRDTYKVMWWEHEIGKAKKPYCVHKNGVFWKFFESIDAFENYVYCQDKKLDKPTSERAETGCMVLNYTAKPNKE